jgi:hypothetical protein
MIIALLLTIACRTDPTPTPAPEPTAPAPSVDTIQSTSPTGDTATTWLPTGDTATTGHTSSPSTATTATTADTGTTAHTGATGDTGPLLDTCGRPVDLATPSTADTGACGQFPASYPADTAAPPVADTGIDCTTDTANPVACPQLAWVLHLPGDTDAWLDDIDTFPNGDLLLVGSDERGMTFHEGEPNEYRVPEICPGLPATPFVARIDADGQLVWAMRPVDGCDTIHTTDVVVNSEGDFAVYGLYFANPGNQTITFQPASANSFVSPPPEGTHDIWVAAYDDQGELLHGHVVSAPRFADYSEHEDIDAIALADDGTLYAAGRFKGELTIDPQEPWATQLLGDPQPTDDPNAKTLWIAAWNADGSLRWARTDATGGKGTGIPKAISASTDQVAMVAIGQGEVLWDACGEEERATDVSPGGGSPSSLVQYSAADGTTTHVDTLTYYANNTNAVSDGGFLVPLVRLGQGPLALGEHVLPEGSAGIAHLGRTCGHYPWVAINHESVAGALIYDAAMTQGYAAVAGLNSSVPVPGSFECGGPLPTGNGPVKWSWYLFSDEGDGYCGDTIDVPDQYFLTDIGVAVDEGGLYFSSSWVGRGTVAAGTAHAFDIDTTTGDLLVYRYAW